MREIVVREQTRITCDGCGKGMNFDSGVELAFAAKVSFGYHSEYDQASGDLHYCQVCGKGIMETLAVKFAKEIRLNNYSLDPSGKWRWTGELQPGDPVHT